MKNNNSVYNTQFSHKQAHTEHTSRSEAPIMKTKEMSTCTIAMLPSIAAGHLPSMIQLAKRLALNGPHLSFTIILMPDPAVASRPLDPPSRISHPVCEEGEEDAHSTVLNFVHLRGHADQSQQLPKPDENTGGVTFLSLYPELHKQAIAHALRSLAASTVISAFVIDLFNTIAMDVSASLGIPTYVFFTSSAVQLAFMLSLPEVRPECLLQDSKEKILVPGVTPVEPKDLPAPLRTHPRDEEFRWFLYHCRRLREARGVLVNTFDQLEAVALAALTEGRCLNGLPSPAVYPVGPLLDIGSGCGLASSAEYECLFKWLDQQANGSVIFLCFGSWGSFSGEQVQEIARGLELSTDQRFIWSVRLPSAHGPKLSAHSDVNPMAWLPAGFIDRTKGRGWVWPGRVPQAEILAHPSTGGFVSHCGWNSVLESVWFGVPLIAWPLYAEQRMNAVQVVRDLGLGLGLLSDPTEKGLVRGEEFQSVVRSLMFGEEGKSVRKKMSGMRDLGRKAMDGGSSFLNLAKVVDKWVADIDNIAPIQPI